MSNGEEILDKEVLEQAREALDWEVSDAKAVYGCLRILLRGFLDRVIEDFEEED